MPSSASKTAAAANREMRAVLNRRGGLANGYSALHGLDLSEGAVADRWNERLSAMPSAICSGGKTVRMTMEPPVPKSASGDTNVPTATLRLAGDVVALVSRVGVRGGLLNVADLSDNGHPWGVGGAFLDANANALADGVLAGPVALGESAVDNDDEGRIGTIGFIEGTATQQRNALGFEVVAHDLGRVAQNEAGALGRNVALGNNCVAVVVAMWPAAWW